MKLLDALGPHAVDPLPRRGAAGEGDTRHVRVHDQGVSDLGPGSGDDVHDPSGQVVEHTAEIECGQRCLRSRLDHHDVPGGEGGGDLPGEEHQRVVERNDAAHHTHRLLDDQIQLSRLGGGDDPPAPVADEACVILEAGRGPVDVAPVLPQGAAGFACQGDRELLPVRAQAARRLHQQLGALQGRHTLPRREGPPGGGHRTVHLDDAPLRDDVHDLLGGRVDDLDGPAGRAFRELPVDPETPHRSPLPDAGAFYPTRQFG